MSSQSLRKNILLIFTDQMHKFAMQCMGTPDIITPNLDQLATEGVLFTNAYTNCPICSPFRINLCSGMYTAQTNTYRNESAIPESCITLADLFNEAGYHTSFVGKWHVGGKGNQPIPKELRGGFQDFIGFQCYNGFYKDVIFYDENNQAHPFNEHRTDVAAQIAMDRIENYAKNPKKPFMMVLGFQAPHYPVQPSDQFAAMYEDKSIQHRKNIKNIDPYIPTASPRSPRPIELCPDFKRYGNNLDEYLRLYYALITQIDANVGKIIQKLKELGIYESTSIIFTSDHGDMQGSHGLKNKTLPYEESAGIPLIIKDQDGVRNMKISTPVSVVDYLPTMLDLAGIENPNADDYPGKSLVGGIKTGILEDHIPAFSEYRNWRLIRQGHWKLVTRGFFNKPSELFNLENDPYELNNVVKERGKRGLVNLLRKKIIMWQRWTKKNKKS